MSKHLDDDIRKGSGVPGQPGDDEGWLGGTSKKKGRGRGAASNARGSDNGSARGKSQRGRGQSYNKPGNNQKNDKTKVLAIAWDKDIIYTLREFPDVTIDSGLKEFLLNQAPIVVATEGGAEVSKDRVSTAVKLSALPPSLTRLAGLKSGEVRAEFVLRNGVVIGAVYFAVAYASDEHTASYNLFKTHPFKAYRPRFVYNTTEFVRAAGPVIWSTHDDAAYVLCTTTSDDNDKKLDLVGGSCNFATDESPAHTAARKLLEDISYAADDASIVRGLLVSLFDTCQKEYLFGSLAYKSELKQLPEQVQRHVPAIGESRALVENSKKSLLWMRPRDILASKEFKFVPQNVVKLFFPSDSISIETVNNSNNNSSVTVPNEADKM